MTQIPIRRALISVYDKSGLEELASGLHAAGVEIVSTGTTAARIASAGVPVTPVEELTGFPECLDGRVKTLHPRVHAGLLADTANAAHQAQLAELGIEPFQLLVSNLYPFEATVASGASPEQCVEQIDIGGPSMVRAAAKNHGSVAVVIEPSRYADVLAAVAEGGFTLDQRRQLAAEAFAHTAAYDLAVASWFASAYAPDETARDGGWPKVAGALWRRADVLRYGENPHQRGALYTDISAERAGLEPRRRRARGHRRGGAAPRQGHVVQQLRGRGRGAARGVRLRRAVRGHHQALQPVRDRDRRRPRRRARQGARLRPGLGVRRGDRGQRAGDRGAGPADRRRVHRGGDRARFRRRGAGHPVREQERPAAPLCCPRPRRVGGMAPGERRDLAAVRGPGGLPGDDPANWQLKAGAPVSQEVLADLAFAWKACRSVKSNAILLASGGASVGVGMGQVNRVDSARLAVTRAGDRAAGSVAASDAYFPFPDGFEILVQAGVRAVAEPGGSIRDHLVIAAAEAAGIPLYFTGVRHFYH